MIRPLFLAAAIAAFLSFGCSAAAQAGASPTPARIRTFEECVSAGYPILRTLPARCTTPDGIVYLDLRPAGGAGKRACTDRCGDGSCQEIVCQSLGCPCAETPQSCPADCPSH